MKINIAGNWLDMHDSDIAFKWSNMRFSDVFADTFSTDFELPMTAQNIRLLDVWSVLSRQGEPFSDMIPCGVMMRGKSFDGLLSVNGIQGNSIKVTVYLLNIPQVLRDADTRLIEDTAETIVDFTERALETALSPDDPVNYTLYQTAGNIIRPNVKLNYILQQIASKSGVIMPAVGDTLRVIGTRQVVCPQVTKQALLLSWGDNGGDWLKYGQQITNEVDTDNVSVVMAKRASVAITAYVHTAIISGAVAILLQSRVNGGAWGTRGTLNSGAVGSTIVTTINAGFVDGAEWRVVCSGWQGQIFLSCEWSDYAITADDYDTPLFFDSAANYALPNWVGEDISYVYYGVLANIPSVSIRELLSSIAWLIGKRIAMMPGEMQLANADVTAEINAQIITVAFDCDQLGQNILIESANGETLASATIGNAKLDASKTLHKSVFAKLQEVGSWDIVALDLYTENDGKWKSQDYNGGWALAERVEHSSGTIYLRPISSWSLMGIDQLTRVCEIEGVTTEDISECDYVYIEGHKFMLIDGTTEDLSGLINFKALLI